MATVYQLAKERSPDGRVRWMRTERPKPGGRWFLDYFDATGRRMREATTATTKAEASSLLRKRESDAARAEALGIANPAGLRMTIAEFLDDVFMPDVRVTLREGTVRSYETFADRIKARFGNRPLRQFTRADVLDYRAEKLRGQKTHRGKLCGKRPAPGTVNREIAFLRAVLYEAFDRELIDRNPAARLKQLPEENTRTRVMSEAEEVKIRALGPEYLNHVLDIATLAGLRRGEILALRRDHVSLDRDLILVSAKSKSHKFREVPITPDLMPTMKRLCEDRVIGKGGANPYLFPDPETGGPMHERKLESAFSRAVERALIRDLHFHDMRRTFSSRLADLGVSLQTIAALLGHGATYVTERYAHLQPETLREAVAKLSKVGRFMADGPTLRTAQA